MLIRRCLFFDSAIISPNCAAARCLPPSSLPICAADVQEDAEERGSSNAVDRTESKNNAGRTEGPQKDADDDTAAIADELLAETSAFRTHVRGFDVASSMCKCELLLLAGSLLTVSVASLWVSPFLV